MMLRPNQIHRRRALGAVALLGVAALLAGPRSASGGDDFARELGAVAQQVKLLLEQKSMDSVAVGEFRGPARLASSSGPSISKALIEALKAAGITIDRNAGLEINGEYRDIEDRDNKEVAVQIKVHVVDRDGEEVVKLEPRGIFNLALIAALTGVTTTLPPDASSGERSKAFLESLDRPKVYLDGTRVSPESGSPYAIEVLVKDGDNFVPRVPTKEGGLAFHQIHRGEAYAIRISNDSPYDAAVTLTIDGLSTFAFSENKNYTHWIVGSKRTLTVPGWHRNNAVADSFVVTEYAKSAAAEALPSSSSLGTITASFFAAWPKGGNPPPDEPSFKKGGRLADATGKGPPVKTNFEDVVRDIGLLRAAVSVRYVK